MLASTLDNAKSHDIVHGMKVGTRSTTCCTKHSFSMKDKDHNIVMIAALKTTANGNKVSAHDSRKGTGDENMKGWGMSAQTGTVVQE